MICYTNHRKLNTYSNLQIDQGSDIFGSHYPAYHTRVGKSTFKVLASKRGQRMRKRAAVAVICSQILLISSKHQGNQTYCLLKRRRTVNKIWNTFLSTKGLVCSALEIRFSTNTASWPLNNTGPILQGVCFPVKGIYT